MVYVTIKEETESKLHLLRQPTVRSWAILVGLISLGLGAAFFSEDYLLWKLAYISGSVYVGLMCLEDWEECILDKTTQKITLKRINVIQKLFETEKGQKIVVDDLDGCVSVSVQEEEVKYAGKGYIVVLHFSAGHSLGVTKTAVIGGRSDQEVIADKISNFLELDKKDAVRPSLVDEMPVEPNDAISCEAEEAAAASVVTNIKDVQDTPSEGSTSPSPLPEKQSSTDESDDSFEQIYKNELAFCNEAMGIPQNDTAQNNSNQE